MTQGSEERTLTLGVVPLPGVKALGKSSFIRLNILSTEPGVAAGFVPLRRSHCGLSKRCSLHAPHVHAHFSTSSGS